MLDQEALAWFGYDAQLTVLPAKDALSGRHNIHDNVTYVCLGRYSVLPTIVLVWVAAKLSR